MTEIRFIKPCRRNPENNVIPEMILKRENSLLKGYYKNDRIAYGTGRIVKSADIKSEAEAILKDPNVAYVHVRSGLYNCFTCRIDRVK